MASLPILTKTGATGSPLTLDKGRFLPANEPRNIAQDRGIAGGGQVKVVSYGDTERFFKVKIDRISKSNRDALITFFEDANVEWGLNTITFTDENSTNYTVRLWNIKGIDFPQVKGGFYNIDLLFRQEIT